MKKAAAHIDCPLDFASGVERTGIYANAFRVVHDSGSEYFVDFCVYSQEEEYAKVVSRIRVQQTFLAVMQERLALDLTLQRLSTPMEES